MTPSPFERNRLADASSPYLRQHADNPVHWQQWTPETLEHARTTGKPILLSVGYAACHWCHVMAHESFEDEKTAQVMNALFVNIKVDREERPDVDQLYMAALHATGEQGGWPLTMFLTPEALPYWGGTYFPPRPSHGGPAFIQVLQHLSDAWHSNSEAIQKNTDALKQHLDKLNAAPMPEDDPGKDLLQDFLARTLKIYDPVNGGIKGVQKFPNAPILEYWGRQAKGNAGSDPAAAFLHTVRQISNGGIYDHLRGGIARYTVDQKWLVPHFEKMLYDNAHYLRHLGLSCKLSGDQLFRKRIEETIDWLEAEIRQENSAFSASLDADSEGVEGKFYTWSAEEIKSVLGDDYLYFSDTYDITEGGNWEHVNIPNRLGAPQFDNAAESKLAPMRDLLLVERNKRIRPGLDDKVLTDWNGYMIRALAELAGQFQNMHWQELAVSAYRFISESSPAGKDLNHSWLNGTSVYPANTTDYAAMINAALELYQLTQEHQYLEDAKAWLAHLEENYSDGAGGFFLTSKTVSDLITRPRCDQDEANPAGSAQLLEAMIRYANLANDPAMLGKASALAKNLYAVSKESPYGMAGFFNALDSYFGHLHVSIVGPDGERRDQLMEIARNHPIISMTWNIGANDHFGTELADDQDEPAAIVCTQQSCSAPIRSPEHLKSYLENC